MAMGLFDQVRHVRKLLHDDRLISAEPLNIIAESLSIVAEPWKFVAEV